MSTQAALVVLACLDRDFCLPHIRLLPVTAVWLAPSAWSSRGRQASAVGFCGLPARSSGSWANRGEFLSDDTNVTKLRAVSPTIAEPWGEGRRPVRPSSNPCPTQTAIRFLSTEAAVSPFCWQLHILTIVSCPEIVLSFAADEIAAVIRHERAHLRFGHPLWLFVERLVESVLWFHPLVRWAGRGPTGCCASSLATYICAATSPEAAVSLLRACSAWHIFNCCARARSLASMAVGESAGVLSQRAVRLSRWITLIPPGRQTYLSLTPAAIAIAAMLLIWIPLDVAASMCRPGPLGRLGVPCALQAVGLWRDQPGSDASPATSRRWDFA